MQLPLDRHTLEGHMFGKLWTPYRWISSTARGLYERPSVKPHVDELTLSVKDRLTFDFGKHALASIALTGLTIAGWSAAIGALPYLLPRVLSNATSTPGARPPNEVHSLRSSQSRRTDCWQSAACSLR